MALAGRAPVFPLFLTLAGLLAVAGAATGQTPFSLGTGPYDPAVPTVAKLRGFGTGATFSHHADVERVLSGLDGASDRIRLERYGRSVEDRDLWLAWVSSPANLAVLDSLRGVNLAVVEGVPIASGPDRPIFVWLSFGVHGDEASSTEAALELVYHLAASRDPVVVRWLEQAVVVVDPLLNPDGHERYVTWFRSVMGPEPDPDPAAREHRPPWPSGRTNHWYSDLNRDWAWGVQPETRARVEAYLATMPQVHVDFHEMDPGSTYFFFPAAPPIHGYYPPSTGEWGKVFGTANAAAFDERGWPYYTGEDYDLYYPGYGDSWPSFLGATGMTYEQAGGGEAGVVLGREGEEPLTLADRAARHLKAAMTTIETAVSHRERRLSDFAAFWGSEARRAPSAPAAWAISGYGASADALAELLVRQGVRVDTLAGTAIQAGLEPYAGTPPAASLAVGTLIVPSDQPFGRYAAALLEPDTTLPDTSLFYDITGWALPFLYDVDAWRVERMPEAPHDPWKPPRLAIPVVPPDGTVALAWSYEEVSDVMAAGRLAARGFRVRVSDRPFTAAGRRFPRGSFVIPSSSQPEELEGNPAALAAAVREAGARPVALESFHSDDGVDLGSDHVRLLRAPRIALASGPGTRPGSVGGAWHLLVAEANLPLDVIRLGDIVAEEGADEDSLAGVERAPLDLDPYTAIVLPDAESPLAYEAALGEEGARRLQAWVRRGGTLIAVRSAAAWLGDSTTGIADLELAPPVPPPGDAARRAPESVRAAEEIRARIPGTLLAVAVDTTAVLGYGYADGRAAVLVQDPTELELAEDGNAWVFADASALAGYLPADARRRLPGRPYAVVLEVGRGRVVAFADDPGFRGIMYGLKKLYLNAALLMP
jgi:hypothetical protein